ncbi:MAG: flagellar brake protein [Oscillospiraceae bacterium]|jgi:c-di-GMP-binding flagellar brake protein YcgR|nr:flagellar brake protein [Oscillospiraceae bacterium]
MVLKKDDIRPGDRVDLLIRAGTEYRTLVEDVEQSGSIIVTVPTYRGTSVVLRKKQAMTMNFYRDNGKYSLSVRVTGYRSNGDRRLIVLERTSDIVKQQRRGYYRLPVVLRTEVRRLSVALPTELHRLPDTLPMMDDVMTYDEAVDALDSYTVDEETVTSRDISISGISVKSRTEFSIGDKLVIKVHLDWPHATEPPISAVVEVRRVEHDIATGQYFVGLEFTGAFAKRDIITKFIYEQQQKRIRQDKLIRDV